jgi:hypothetical protein
VDSYINRAQHGSFQIDYKDSTWYLVVTIANVTKRTENVDLRVALIDLKYILPKTVITSGSS